MIPNNILVNVPTYQLAELEFLQNRYAFIKTANKKFENFHAQQPTGQLGQTVNIELPPRATTVASLVASFQGAQQRLNPLTCASPISSSYLFTSQQYIFNVEDYMDRFGKAAISEMGAKIEADVANVCVTSTYRFYGNGVTPINSSLQLAQALAQYRDFGAASGTAKGYLPVVSIPGIVNSNLGQFAMKRNDEQSNSWELGNFSDCEWYSSNLLPVHVAGTEGQAGSTLTVVSTTLASDGAVATITFSGTHGASDANSVQQYDKFQFNDGVSGYPNMRFLTYIGREVSASPVQFQATAAAASTSGSQVTVSIFPPLQVNQANDQNINNAIVAGMTVSVLPTHRAGLIIAGNPLFLAMPQLPDQTPFPTGNAVDMESGASFRHYYGARFGTGELGTIRDCVWGKLLAQDYGMALIFPV
jgi:hypothetical protein